MTTPITREQAEAKTRLTAREMTSDDESCAMLRCQLGRITREERPDPRNGSPMNVSVFNLIKFGRTWSEAVRRPLSPIH